MRFASHGRDAQARPAESSESRGGVLASGPIQQMAALQKMVAASWSEDAAGVLSGGQVTLPGAPEAAAATLAPPRVPPSTDATTPLSPRAGEPAAAATSAGAGAGTAAADAAGSPALSPRQAAGRLSEGAALFAYRGALHPLLCIPEGAGMSSEGAMTGRSTASDGAWLSFQDAVARATQATEEEEEEAVCTHEVVVTREVDADGRALLLIYQNDVTQRSHLEESMTQLTAAQTNMLCQIFPRHFIEHLSLNAGAPATAQVVGQLARSHENVTILFMDIVGFTSMSKQVHPVAVMTFLNEFFSVLDKLSEVHGVQKVETAGDCYIVAAGIMSTDKEGFSQVDQAHDACASAAKVVAFAKDMLKASRGVRMPHDGTPLVIRVGIHTGPCVSGLVGSRLPKFGIFGDTMNTASRMESTCQHGRIQISSHTHALLMASGRSSAGEWQPTGGVEVKGKGIMDTYLLNEAACGAAAAAEAGAGVAAGPSFQAAASGGVSEQPPRAARRSLRHAALSMPEQGGASAAMRFGPRGLGPWEEVRGSNDPAALSDPVNC